MADVSQIVLKDASGNVIGTYDVKDTSVPHDSKSAESGGTTLSLVTTGEKATWNAKSDTDNKVAQTATSTNADYEVLFSETADNTTRTEGTRKNNNLKFNPSNGRLSTTSLRVNSSSGTKGVVINNGILLKNSTFTNDIATFKADYNSGGGSLELNNAAGNGQSVSISSDSNNSGSIYLSKSDASTTDKNRVQISSSNGGAIYLKDNTATNTINLTGIDGNINAKSLITPHRSVAFINPTGDAGLYAKKNLNSSAWYPAVCLDTYSGGHWQIGNYADEMLQFVYGTKANRDSNTNRTFRCFIRPGNADETWYMPRLGTIVNAPTFSGKTTYSYTGISVEPPSNEIWIVRAYFRYVNTALIEVGVHNSPNTGNEWNCHDYASGKNFTLNFMVYGGEKLYYWARCGGTAQDRIDQVILRLQY